MPGLPEIYAELQKVFLDRFASPREGHPGDARVAFAFGTPIPDDSFRLDDPLRTVSPQLATEFMASHADVVPDLRESCFIRSTRTVSNQFMLLLNGATTANAGTEELLGLVKSECKPLFEPVLGLKGEYRNLQTTPENWFDVSDEGNWTQVVINHQDSPPPPPPGGSGGSHGGFDGSGGLSGEFLVWKKPPDELTELLAQPVSSATFQVEPVKKLNIKPAVFQPHVLDEQVLNVSRPAAALRLRSRRSSFSDQIMVEGQHRFERQPEVLIEPRKRKFISAAEITELVTVVREQSVSQPVVADGFRLSLRYCMVELKRPWLSDALLSLPGWFVHGFAKGDFSQGVSSNVGNMAYVPTACIIVRDVSIAANWNDSDKTALQSSSELGGFSLLGRSYDQNTQTLNIPGMQSFAWICQPMPVLPPADPPPNS